MKKEEDIGVSIKEENMSDENERERQSEADEERDGAMIESRDETEGKEAEREERGTARSSKEVKTNKCSAAASLIDLFVFSNPELFIHLCDSAAPESCTFFLNYP